MNLDRPVQETHDGKRLKSTSSRIDLSNAGRHAVSMPHTCGEHLLHLLLTVMLLIVVRIAQQSARLLLRLLVVEKLVMRKSRIRSKHMDNAGHVRVNQADETVVAGLRKLHGKALPRDQRR